MKKLFQSVLLIAAAAFLVWLVWLRPVKVPEEEQKPEAQAPVRVTTITKQTLRSYVILYGNIEPAPTASARLAASVPGVITGVHCVEGQRVEKGALLFRLDSRAAELALNFAEKAFERQRKLAQAETTSQKALQESEQQLSAARAQLALLEIHSPFAGTVAKVNVKTGEAADLTTVLAELIDTDHLGVTCNVPSSDLRTLKVGQPAEIGIQDTTNTVPSSVAFISPQVDSRTDTGVVRLSLPADSGFRSGQFVKVRVVTAEHKDCLAVPLACVATDSSGGPFIALIEGEKAVLKPVKTGLREGNWVEVEGEGVEADKTVVTEGAYGLIVTQQFATKVRITKD
jgi:membrane fusion protein (multidrug efflux system)